MIIWDLHVAEGQDKNNVKKSFWREEIIKRVWYHTLSTL